MESLSALLALCEGNPFVTVVYPHNKYTVLGNFDVSFIVNLNKLLNKQLNY